jgi:hypothetical protein
MCDRRDGNANFCFISSGIQSVLHDQLAAIDGPVGIPSRRQQSTNNNKRADPAHDLHHPSPGVHVGGARTPQRPRPRQNPARYRRNLHSLCLGARSKKSNAELS